MSTPEAATSEIPRDIRKIAMLCHIVALVGLLGNGIGFILGPLIVWLVKREDHDFINEQGKEAVNFQITMMLAMIVAVPLIFVVIGIPLALIIGIAMTVLPVIAAIKANDGESYKYPLTYRFLK